MIIKGDASADINCVHIEGGVRYDHFPFRADDKVHPRISDARGASRAPPKFSLACHRRAASATIYFNYGRGIASQDARGVVQQPDGERVSTTVRLFCYPHFRQAFVAEQIEAGVNSEEGGNVYGNHIHRNHS